MEIDEIEHKIACGEMTAAQVFTQMKQHVGKLLKESNEEKMKIVHASQYNIDETIENSYQMGFAKGRESVIHE